MLTSRHKESQDDNKHTLAKIVKDNMFVDPKCQVGQA